MAANRIQSLAIASLFPKTMDSAAELGRTLRRLKGRGFGMVEFYTQPGHDDAVAALLAETGFESILIGVYPLKQAGYSLCAPNETERRQAVGVLCENLDRAAALGCRALMVNSGFLPEDPAQTAAACRAYVRSIREGYAHIARMGYGGLEITLEPGDSKVQSFQLLGPTHRVLGTTWAIGEFAPGYGLTMDVAHLREEGEDVLSALRQTLPHCGHVHLCNCVMDDAADAMYGDKHVDFDWPGACFDYGSFEAMYREILKMYEGRDLIVTLEAQCRAQDNDAWFDGMAQRCAWLFNDEGGL